MDFIDRAQKRILANFEKKGGRTGGTGKSNYREYLGEGAQEKIRPKNGIFKEI